jgi:hypothetical protein
MEAIREITTWEDNTPNHTYLLNKAGRCIAYIKQGTTDTIKIKNPRGMAFYKTRRKFEKVSVELFEL